MIYLKYYYILFKLHNNISIKNITTSFTFKFEDSFDFKKKINKHLSSLTSTTHSEFFDNSNSILKNSLKLLLISVKKTLINKHHTLKSIHTTISTYVFVFLNISKWILIPAIISGIYFYSSLFFIQIDFTKQIAVWFVLLVIFYILMSTFNNFLNKYK